jgi:diketogulonate reductase-like aldo/keto reductase
MRVRRFYGVRFSAVMVDFAECVGRTRLLGVSDFTLSQLRLLCRKARVRPRFVQNRCYAARGSDRDVRAFWGANGLL